MSRAPIRIGFIGLQPGGGWGTRAHLPALQGLRDVYEVAGVANSSAASGRRAASELGLSRSFDSVDELVSSPDIDMVSVTVKVPHHHEMVGKALAAGKHVYCEWPLGNGLAEARDLAERARAAGVVAVAGTQALYAPEIVLLKSLLNSGYVGNVLSTSISGVGGIWGSSIAAASAYTLDRANGANLLTIPVGHTLAALTHVLGPIAELSAILATRRPTVRATDRDEVYRVSSPDEVIIGGMLENGVPMSLCYHGGAARGTGFCWEINGSAGDLRLTGERGQSQLTQLTLEGGTGDAAYARINPPDAPTGEAAPGPVVGNVRRLYAAMARDLRAGTRIAPTFDDAVALHQVLASVETSAETGRRIRPADM